jgi:glycine/D-amino acid oxidase-like deaminating enzyme
MRCLWLDEALADGAPAPQPRLTGDHATDVCIVGGGFAGLWTALRLRDAGAEVTLLEARVCGSGASCRNGGFALSWWSKIETLLKLAGPDEARRLALASVDAIGELGTVPEGGFRRAGWAWCATSDAQLGAWDGAAAAAERLGEEPFEAVERGVLEAAAAVVQPARLAFALRQLAIERGVRIHEDSPVAGLRDGVARTALGRVEARAIVLTTGAWLARRRPLRRVIVPVSSDVVATEPVDGLEQPEARSDTRLMVHYWRRTDDGRLVFGRGGGALGFAGRFDFDEPGRRAAAVERDMRAVVPAAARARVTHAWGGGVDRTQDGLPVFGRLSPGVVYGGGFSGNGVAPSAVAGRVLASLALGRDDEWSRCALVRAAPGRFPPEPVRHLGGRLVRRAVERQEGLADAGREASHVTRALASLAPAGRATRPGRAAAAARARRSTP